MTDAQDRNPWDRMPDEPFDWHARFQICCDRGPSHSLSGAGPADLVGKVRTYSNVEHVRRRPRKRRNACPSSQSHNSEHRPLATGH